MKKLLLSTALLLATSYAGVTAQIPGENIDDKNSLQANIIDPTKENGPIRRVKSVVRIPTISIDDHTLTINKPYGGCTLQLFDENGVLQYSTIIPENYATIVLPAYLKGDYDIQITRGSFILYTLYVTL
jgi:hypothetical protein